MSYASVVLFLVREIYARVKSCKVCIVREGKAKFIVESSPTGIYFSGTEVVLYRIVVVFCY